MVALSATALELGRLALAGPADYSQTLFGWRFSGNVATLVLLVHLAVWLPGAWGLWTRRAWARWLAMAYLGYLLGCFMIWGVRDVRQLGAGWALAWHVALVPSATFAVGFLWQGGRYFESAAVVDDPLASTTVSEQ